MNQLLAFERELKKTFPQKWSSSTFSFFAGKPTYQPDLVALSSGLGQPITDFLSRGGKRVRPLLFFASLRALGKKPDQFVDMAIAIEIIHNGTLVLDDIEDGAELRRGKPACHLIFGTDVGINVGTSMHFLPLQLILNQQGKLSDGIILRTLKIYTEEVIRVSLGQATDIIWHKEIPEELGIKKYLEMCRLKTGSLMRMSTRMACAISDTSIELEEKFSFFGEVIGIAFQIRDDVLDLSTSTVEFGKSYGNDITEGKMSLPVLYALEELDETEAKELRNILQEHTIDPQRKERAISLIKKTRAIEKADIKAQKLIKKAWDNLESALTAQEKVGDLSSLKDLAYNFITRTK